MKLTAKEKDLIKSRRKFIGVIKNSKKILAYRKSSKESKGEQKISEFLKAERIEFKREWFFRGLYNNATKQLLYFDFYLPDYHVCIEYDGEQHYAKDKTENEKVNDFLKNAYCLKNKIPFLRIKYDDFDNIETIICKFFDKTS
jgi:very-short-patch-repair endonuclease